MTDLWKDLLGCLELRAARPPQADTDANANANASVTASYEGDNQQLSYHRLFGGQLLAQFVRAACLSHADKSVKSLHVLFPRTGSSEEPVRYDVTRHHEGGTFATLAITARQQQGVIATASVSMHVIEAGPDVQTVAEIPPVPDAARRVSLDLLPWDTRSLADLDAPEAAPPEFDLWMRTPAVDPELAHALTAYATDLTLIGTALRGVEGVSQQDAGSLFTSAVTSHTVWFHRPLRTDDWLLLRQHSPLLAYGRCFGRGDVLTETGSLVASYAQEALLRFTG